MPAFSKKEGVGAVMRTTSQRVSASIIGLILMVASLVFLVPFAMIILNSLKDIGGSYSFDFSLPERLMFSNYTTVLQSANIGRSMINGVIYSAFTSITVVILSSMGSFVLSRNKTRANSILYYVFIMGLVIPFMIVPTIRIMQLFNVYGSYLGLILIYAATNVPFAVFLYTGYIKTINRDIDEAAVIDGCNAFNMFFRIIFPLLTPVTITLVLLMTIGIWNEFQMQIFFVADSQKWGVALTIYNFFAQYHRQWNMVCANIVIISFPMVLLFLFFQKYIVSGMAAGAVKG